MNQRWTSPRPAGVLAAAMPAAPLRPFDFGRASIAVPRSTARLTWTF
jgi:hypothetical protein